MKKLFSLLLGLSITLSIVASDFYFYNINSDKGLSQNNVKSIFQDSYGFMWFGTKNRLNRYDGNSIKIFDCYDVEKGRGNNNIGVIFESVERVLWLGTDKGVYIFNPVDEIFHFLDLKTDDEIVIEEWVSSIIDDSLGNIWIVAPNQGAFRYNKEKKELILYTVVDDLKPSVSTPQCIALDKDGKVWIGTNGAGIYEYNLANDSFTQYVTDINSGISLSNKNIYSIAHYGEDIIIAIHEEEIYKFNKKNHLFSRLGIKEADFKIIRHLSILNGHELWVGTHAGLFVVDLENNDVRHAHEDLIDKHALSDNVVETVYTDREGGVWVGTISGGVDYLPKFAIDFKRFSPSSSRRSLNSKKVRSIIEDQDRRIWVATEDAGLFVLDKNKEDFNSIKNLHNHQILTLLEHNDEIWAGYFKNGLDVVSKAEIHRPKFYSPSYMGLNEESVYALCRDRTGQIWLGTAWGVFTASKNKMEFDFRAQFGLAFIHDIMEDTEGHIWIATMGSGVFMYNQETKDITHFVTSSNENSLSSNSVSSITEDHAGRIWFSTDRGGISVYNKEQQSFKKYSIVDGLPDDVAYKIVEDKDCYLWFGTNKGLVRFDPMTETTRVFTQDDGLPSNQFNYNSGVLSKDGIIYLGTSEGLVSFNPQQINENKYIPPIYITKLSLSNKEVNPNTENSPLQKSIAHTSKIELPYNQANITLDFIALSYTSSKSNKVAYMLENIDTDWSYTTSNSVSYGKLSPGKYVFKVKGRNNDGLWNPESRSLEIVITPPWWQSSSACFIYLILLLALGYLIIQFSLIRLRRQTQQKQKMFRVEKERELYEAKVNFFTNITHEIRTPLTLINGPLEFLQNKVYSDNTVHAHLNIIEKNANNLLHLINQLLDIKKIDGSKIQLNFRNLELIGLLKDTIKLFEIHVESIDKTIQLHAADDVMFVVADKRELVKIVNNLLLNAVKYSKSNINVFLHKENGSVNINVSNDGRLIEEEFQTQIFDPFFQIQDIYTESVGSGIGLSLARSLAELHHGSLTYNTTNNLNNFILSIPIHQEAKQEKQEDEYEELHESINTTDRNKENLETPINRISLLVVEDNMDILLFLTNQLKNKYTVYKASDGVKALEVLAETKIDIVLSDVMMPRMDGFELCKQIKEDSTLSHVMVILLTAKNDINSKVKGLELGADAYVEKPFSFRYLYTLLDSLLASKIRDSNLFGKKPILFQNQLNMNKAEEMFINKMTEIIQDNLSNAEFNVNLLANLMNISRSNLHRQMTEIIDSTPTQYIRLVRMQKAADLMTEGLFRVNEVCYLVGINTPSYFIKLFQEQFGMTPKEYIKHINE